MIDRDRVGGIGLDLYGIAAGRCRSFHQIQRSLQAAVMIGRQLTNNIWRVTTSDLAAGDIEVSAHPLLTADTNAQRAVEEFTLVVLLRPLLTDDCDRLFLWRNNPDVARHMYTSHNIGLDEHRRWFARIGGDGSRYYWICEVDGEPAGLVNLADIDLGNRRCSWAYYIAELAARGKGVGSAIEFAVLDYVFNSLGLNKLWCEVLIENEQVIALHQQFGFSREAGFRDHIYKDGRFIDVVGLGMTAADWRTKRATAAKRLHEKSIEPARIT